ncbi:MAG: histidine kinase [Lachnospiraceae bacterium]|nr:histidine kinase [Lachnospiraceae bacterium]
MLRNKAGKKKRYISIQTKLISVFFFTTAIVFTVNVYMYINFNRMIKRIDEIYVSNANSNELQNGLNQVQNSMSEYLNTKSSDSMEEYFRSEEKYSGMLQALNDTIVENDNMIMEKNIRRMSESYLSLTNDIIEAKRGRNVERYKVLYEEAGQLYSYINTYIYTLNNKQFQNNSENYSALFATLKYMEVVNMVILCIVALLNALLTIVLTRGITRPLKQLSEAANQVAQGNLDIEPTETESRDEVGVVTGAFNQMVLSLQAYIRRLKESLELESAMKEKELMMETHLKDAQLKYLQAQINPHFLFNTLNAGAQLAMMEEAEKTYRYIQNVADFFRYNIKESRESVSLNQEIEIVDNYIYILNVRFSGEIHFRKHVDESLTNVQVPSMILQPIVENCINYGIRNIEWEGYIDLSVYKERNHICVSIRDNGTGMSEEKIQKIMSSRQKEDDSEQNSNGIGLDNVIGRLRLFFGIEKVMEITSAGENMGTEVAIFIPYEEKENGHV